MVTLMMKKIMMKKIMIMNRKKLIEDNLVLLNSKDNEAKDLILNILFPDTFNLTIKFESEELESDYRIGKDTSVFMFVIDTATQVQLYYYGLINVGSIVSVSSD